MVHDFGGSTLNQRVAIHRSIAANEDCEILAKINPSADSTIGSETLNVRETPQPSLTFIGFIFPLLETSGDGLVSLLDQLID